MPAPSSSPPAPPCGNGRAPVCGWLAAGPAGISGSKGKIHGPERRGVRPAPPGWRPRSAVIRPVSARPDRFRRDIGRLKRTIRFMRFREPRSSERACRPKSSNFVLPGAPASTGIHREPKQSPAARLGLHSDEVRLATERHKSPLALAPGRPKEYLTTVLLLETARWRIAKN
jgi:hypothetical protein